MKADRKLLAALVAATMVSTAAADEREELLKLRNTTLNLVDLLVQQGILDKKKADAMIKQAEIKAAEEARVEAKKEAEAGTSPKEGKLANGKPGSGPVRVTYVPDFVKDEIRQDVRKELRDEVVKEVKSQAKEEKWGVPAALPDWVNRFKLSGDMRLRGEGDFYGSDNPSNDDLTGPRFDASPYPFVNGQALNSGNSLANVTKSNPAYFNTSQGVNRYRMRLRLGLEAQIADGLKAGVRLATSNSRSPVSTNQTLGQTGQQYDIALDRGFLQYDYIDKQGTDWLTVWAGRTINPWLSTDNVFDSDLSFEGVSATARLPLGGGSSHYTAPPPNVRYGINLGYSQPNSVFLTGGLYPLQGELQMASKNKWLMGGQTGLDLLFNDNSRVKFGVAYYDYRNIQGETNSTKPAVAGDQGDRNYTAPQFMQKGNTLMQINTSGDRTVPIPSRVGLASGFQIFDAVAALEYGGFGDTHVALVADYAKNLGFNRNDILARNAANGGINGIVNYQDLKDRTTAWQVRMDVGAPQINKLSDWNLTFAYKYVERDAVLDAFTDSDFHLGGTNAKGWVIGGSYGLAKNTWLNARWMSADQIDEYWYPVIKQNKVVDYKRTPFGIDVLMVDLNARF